MSGKREKGGHPLIKRSVITSLPEAFEIVKEMSLDFEEPANDKFDWRNDGRKALKDTFFRANECPNRQLFIICIIKDISDRLNGSFSRHLLTELGDIELSIPRTREYNPKK